MNDLYEFFNEVDMDVEKYEAIDANISDMTKKRLIRNFRKSEDNFKFKRELKLGKIPVAVGLAMVIGSIFMIENPALAKSMPVVGTVLNFLEENSTFINPEYSKYKENLNIESEDKGIAITLNSAVYDGNYLYLNYKLKSNKSFDASNVIDKATLTINGVQINGNQKLLEKENVNKDYKIYDDELISTGEIPNKLGGTSEDALQEYGEYVGLARWDLSNYQIDKKVNIEFNIDSIGKTQGNWSFKFSASKDQLIAKTTRIDNAGTLKIQDNMKLNLDKIIISPFGTTIENTMVTEKGKWKDKIMGEKSTSLLYNYVFVTDKGEELFPEVERVLHEENSNGKDVYKRYTRFTAPKEIPSSITIVPILQKKDIINYDINDYEWIKIGDLKIGKEIPQGKGSAIVINSIHKSDKYTKINISFKGLDIIHRNNIFVVKDKERYGYLINNLTDKKKEFELSEVKRDPEEFKKPDRGLKNYSVSGNNYTFKGIISDDAYLAVPKYDSFYEVDLKDSIKINLN
ncbi:DUF4179 domain-containing protein [Clostridium sp. 'White wine YQ']|uniref:DUF4179 domain-containing protein n=1 Tax=Clostridium sp. 'White wine YQ' TaxID=3027474 RepID=UPI0023672C81|nr:DUF4179 domain-containing protein [Clostridium sp. 'White wine YQ']MDD7795850.1 DUF4179 domain-containing protein [Clostridium sp. 'White wine YQ']